MKWLNEWSLRLAEKERDGLKRTLRTIHCDKPGSIVINGRICLDLSSNDYLGFAREPLNLADVQVDPGAGASRLIVGDLLLHHRLEERLARFKGTEAALLYPSGYQCNIGLLTALAERNSVIVSDRLNHASLIDGARLSGGKLIRYPHGDVRAARNVLDSHRDRPCLLVTDAVFSMDGDVAPLPELLDLAVEYDALLVVDEAHATGVLGSGGAGAWHEFGLPTRTETPVVLMGTMSKALGAQGGFVCGPRVLIDYLVNTSRAFIYSTGISPLNVHAAMLALDRLEREPRRLTALRENALRFRTALQAEGIDTGGSTTPIVPVVVGSAERALECSRQLEERGILGVAIRPPTVPVGTSRLRFTVTAVHDPAELERTAGIIAEVVKR